MIGNQSLSRSVLSGSSGASPLDELSMQKVSYRLGGTFPEGNSLAELYDQTGNMRVARTLENYRKVRAQKGKQGGVYGVTDPNKPGRVFRDAADMARQKKNEGSGSHFQKSLAEEERKALTSGAKEYNYTDPITGEVKRIALGQGAGADAGPGTASVGLGDGSSGPDGDGPVPGEEGMPNNIIADGTGNETVEFTEGENGPGADMNWWQKNQSALGDGFGDLVEGYANIFPNLDNMRDYKNLPGITAPMLQRGVPLERPNFDSYQQSILAQGRNMQNQAGYDTAQSGAQAGQRASALAKTQSELSRLAGYEGNLRADIANKERVINSRIDAGNISSVNKYYDDVTERDLYQTQGIANERSQIAKNVLGFTGGQRQRKLDRQNMAMVKQRFQHEGTMNRAIEDAVKNKDWEAVNALTSGASFGKTYRT